MTEMRTRTTGRHLSSCPDQTDCFSIDLLGPLRVVTGGRELALSSRRQRTLLVLLAMNANSVVTADRLIDQLWNGTPPPGALVTLRSYISHVRKALDEHVDGRARITTTDAGYRLDVESESLDTTRFRVAVAAGHRHQRAGEARQALAAFDTALAMWRGEPMAEMADHEAATAQAAELLELRAGAVEGRLRALVEAGRHVEATSGLEALVSTDPLREGAHELLMIALYRSGRSAEALEVHRRFRTTLQEELGIDPSPRLDQLMTAMLNRDPRLDPVSSVTTPERSDLSPTDLVATLIETLRTVGTQLAAVVDVLGTQLPPGSSELTLLSNLATTLDPQRHAEANLGAVIAS